MPDPEVVTDVVVVVPAHNEEGRIAGVVTGLREWFPRVLCVDDGSSDRTMQEARAAGAQVLRHPFNLGQGAALQTGIEWSLRDPSVAAIVTFDGDGQHRPEDALAAVQLWRCAPVDVVLGSRFLEETSDIPLMRRVILKSAVVFTRWTTGLSVTDTHNGLRLLNRRAATHARFGHAGMAHASEMLSIIRAAELTWVELPMVVTYESRGQRSGQSLWNSVNIFFDVVWRPR